MKRTLYKHIFIIFFVGIISTSPFYTLYAQPGTIDPTFGDNGIFIGRNYGNCYGATLQPDGKLIMIGEGFTETNTGFGLARLTVDGNPDESFGDHGRVVSDFDFEVQVAFDATMQQDGKIVVAGVNYEDDNSRNNFLVARYLSDGRLDSSFAVKGWLTTDFNGDDYARSVAVQPDGKIVVAGSNTYRALIARYNTDGTLDGSFGKNGLVIMRVNSFPVINAMALQADGKIVLAGTLSSNPNGSVVMCRYMPDGTPDESFGSSGVIVSDWVNGYGEICNDMVLQNDGKILVAGCVVINGVTEGKQAIVRYNENGSFDESFGVSGISIISIPNEILRAESLKIQNDGKIVIAGLNSKFDGSSTFTTKYYLSRLMQNGSNDNIFGTNGLVFLDIGESERAYNIFITDNEKLLLTGSSEKYTLPYENNFIAIRLNGGEGSLPITYKNFTASQKNGFIQLNWETTNEVNNKYFVIERSSAISNSFTEITRINSIANNVTNDYSYMDKLPAEGSNQYRIKQVDKDGKSSYSKTISVLFTKNANIKIQPNPAKDKLIISGLLADENNNITVTDMQGRKLLQLNCRSVQHTINIQALPIGHYLLTVQNKTGNFNLKFIKHQ